FARSTRRMTSSAKPSKSASSPISSRVVCSATESACRSSRRARAAGSSPRMRRISSASSGSSSPSTKAERRCSSSRLRVVSLIATLLGAHCRAGSSLVSRHQAQGFVAEVLTQDGLHLRPRVEEPAHHRPLRDVQRLREFLVAHPLDLPKHEDFTVLLRKLGQRPGHLRGQLLAKNASLRGGPQTVGEKAGFGA